MTRAVVVSSDFDRTLCDKNQAAIDKNRIAEVFKKNFFKNPTAKNFLLVGSNSQSVDLDQDNMQKYKRPSCMASFRELAQHFNDSGDLPSVELVTLLLNDIFANAPDGTTFEAALTGEKVAASLDQLIDGSKILLAYVQMQHMAQMLGSDTPIDFYFVDDIPRIRADLADVFTKLWDLLPANITLHIVNMSVGYDGNPDFDPKLEHVISGGGVVNPEYKSVARKLMQTATDDYEKFVADPSKNRQPFEFLREDLLAMHADPAAQPKEKESEAAASVGGNMYSTFPEAPGLQAGVGSRDNDPLLGPDADAETDDEVDKEKEQEQGCWCWVRCP
jgi:hypothetical protein